MYNVMMSEVANKLYRAAQVREFDRLAIDVHGIPGYMLMQRAGSSAFELIQQCWPQTERLLVMAGTGNNGGDGYVVAHLAQQAGLVTQVIQLGEAEKIRGDALQAREAYLAVGGEVQAYDNKALPAADLIVDALLGTGLERELEGLWRNAIDAINHHPAAKLAIDIPSGLHSDTGVALPIAMDADATITFIGYKQGLFTGYAADYCGDLYFDDLDVPQDVYDAQQPAACLTELSRFEAALQPRRRTQHKGDFGHVLVIGGDHGMPGAVRLAAEAASRVGSGMVTVATRTAHVAAIVSGCPWIMCRGIDDVNTLQPLLHKASVIAIGPGLGQSTWSRMLLLAVLDSNKPLVMDADALNLLARDPLHRSNWVLTPHPGEAARLLATSSKIIQQDRFGSAEQIQARYGGVAVLKGAASLISDGERLAVCAAGNPGMASGGMGDVLTGVIAGLLAQGFGLADAAELGVCLHASAADQAAVMGERGLVAADLFPFLRQWVNP